MEWKELELCGEPVEEFLLVKIELRKDTAFRLGHLLAGNVLDSDEMVEDCISTGSALPICQDGVVKKVYFFKSRGK